MFITSGKVMNVLEPYKGLDSLGLLQRWMIKKSLGVQIGTSDEKDYYQNQEK